MVIKLYGLGPGVYFQSAFNKFDCIVSILTFQMYSKNLVQIQCSIQPQKKTMQQFLWRKKIDNCAQQGHSRIHWALCYKIQKCEVFLRHCKQNLLRFCRIINETMLKPYFVSLCSAICSNLQFLCFNWESVCMLIMWRNMGPPQTQQNPWKLIDNIHLWYIQYICSIRACNQITYSRLCYPSFQLFILI